jgi:hypothetical protein
MCGWNALEPIAEGVIETASSFSQNGTSRGKCDRIADNVPAALLCYGSPINQRAVEMKGVNVCIPVHETASRPRHQSIDCHFPLSTFEESLTTNSVSSTTRSIESSVDDSMLRMSISAAFVPMSCCGARIVVSGVGYIFA